MRPREFEMSLRAPVSSRLDLFSSRGSDFPRAPASVVRSLINGIDFAAIPSLVDLLREDALRRRV